MRIEFVFDTSTITQSIKQWWHRTWENNPWKQLPRLRNKWYSFYYTHKYGKILTSKERYDLQPLIFSEDKEAVLLGITLLLKYSAGNDLLSRCSYRMSNSSDYEEQHHPNKVDWYPLGILTCAPDLTIQTILNTVKKIYNKLPDSMSIADKYNKLIVYVDAIRYWMLYHPRIGSNIDPIVGAIRYPNPVYNHDAPTAITGTWLVYEWDWYTRSMRWGIPASEYWKHYNK